MNESTRIAERRETTDTPKPWGTPTLTICTVDQAEFNPTPFDDGFAAGS